MQYTLPAESLKGCNSRINASEYAETGGYTAKTTVCVKTLVFGLNYARES
jgi:hypothetical protein